MWYFRKLTQFQPPISTQHKQLNSAIHFKTAYFTSSHMDIYPTAIVLNHNDHVAPSAPVARFQPPCTNNHGNKTLMNEQRKGRGIKTKQLVKGSNIQITERKTYFGLTFTPTLSRPIFPVQASRPTAINT